MRRGRKKRLDWSNIKTPCVKICTLEKGICIGCGRTQDEIREWVILTDEERSIISRRLQNNGNKLRIR